MNFIWYVKFIMQFCINLSEMVESKQKTEGWNNLASAKGLGNLFLTVTWTPSTILGPSCLIAVNFVSYFVSYPNIDLNIAQTTIDFVICHDTHKKNQFQIAYM